MNQKPGTKTLDNTLKGTSNYPRLEGKWLRVARIAWIILAVVALFIYITSLPGHSLRITSSVPGHGTVEVPSPRYVLLQSVNTIISLASSVLSFSLSLILFRRKFENPAVVAVSFYLLFYSIVMTGPLEAWGYYWIGNIDFAVTMQAFLMATPTIALLVLFPNGKFVPRWTRWVMIASVPWSFFVILFPITSGQITGLLILGSLWITLIGLGLYAQVFRFRWISTPDERQQTKWVLFGFVIWLGYILISTYPYFYLTSLSPGTPQPWWVPISELSWWLSLNIIPITMAIAIGRSRLWNIDIVINRTLVYGALTLSTMVLYIFVVGTLGNLLQVGDNTFLAFLATGLVAVLFQPIQDRLQHWVNRLMYGERDEPVAVITKLGEQIERTGTPETTLAGIVETVAQTLKLPYVAIELGNGEDIAASYGIPVNESLRLPLVYQGESVGYFVVARRAREEFFSDKDLQLLENIARQAGAAAHNVRLTADLQRAHQRLVSAREEERRRIRRDLHDGLGPQLASQTLTLTAARRIYKEDPQAADKLLDEAIKHAQTATEDIRRVVHDLRPPALDDLGLIGAIKSQIDQFKSSGVQISMNIPEFLPPMPAAVEAACYMICQEALNNVTRHSGASTCKIDLTYGTELCLEIRDNGCGISDNPRTGVGLTSMRQRAEELGGTFELSSEPGKGTQLTVCLPSELSGV